MITKGQKLLTCTTGTKSFYPFAPSEGALAILCILELEYVLGIETMARNEFTSLGRVRASNDHVLSSQSPHAPCLLCAMHLDAAHIAVEEDAQLITELVGADALVEQRRTERPVDRPATPLHLLIARLWKLPL